MVDDDSKEEEETPKFNRGVDLLNRDSHLQIGDRSIVFCVSNAFSAPMQMLNFHE
jgi:hypothetical protein